RHEADDRTGPRAAVPLCLQHAPHGEPGRDTAVRRHAAAERSTGDSVQHSRRHRASGRGESAATRAHARHRPDDADAEPQAPGAGSSDRPCSAPRRPRQGDDADIQREKSPRGGAPALGPRSGQGAPRAGDDRVGGRAAAAGPLASGRRQEARADSGPEPCPAEARTKGKPLMSIERRMRGRVHYGWIVVAVTFVTLLAAAGIRSAPGVLMIPLEREFGWTRATVSFAVSINLFLYGLSGPFIAGLMDRLGIRRVMVTSLGLVATGVALTTLMTSSWQLAVLWGVVVGLGTGTMASVLGAMVANRWFTERRGVVLGLLTARVLHGSAPCGIGCSHFDLSSTGRGG